MPRRLRPTRPGGNAAGLPGWRPLRRLRPKRTMTKRPMTARPFGFGAAPRSWKRKKRLRTNPRSGLKLTSRTTQKKQKMPTRPPGRCRFAVDRADASSSWNSTSPPIQRVTTPFPRSTCYCRPSSLPLMNKKLRSASGLGYLSRPSPTLASRCEWSRSRLDR